MNVHQSFAGLVHFLLFLPKSSGLGEGILESITGKKNRSVWKAFVSSPVFHVSSYWTALSATIQPENAEKIKNRYRKRS